MVEDGGGDDYRSKFFIHLRSYLPIDHFSALKESLPQHAGGDGVELSLEFLVTFWGLGKRAGAPPLIVRVRLLCVVSRI